MKHRQMLIVFLLSITIISLELTWTRIFSAEFFYTFAFLILSIAILGLGLGALALRFFPKLGDQKWLGLLLSLTGIATLVGPPLVFQLDLTFAELINSWMMVFKLLLAICILSSAFFFGGIALAAIFKNNHKEIHRFYMADLIGAGLGVVLIILFMNSAGTPIATFYTAIPILLAAIFACRKWGKIFPGILIILTIFISSNAAGLLEKERKEHAPVMYKHWDAIAKIKLFDYGPDFRGINIDNVANSPVYGFDGNWDRPDSMQYEFGIDVSYLINQFDSCTFLSLGAGGGTDVLQALQFGATEVHAVEVNPHINYMMVHGDSSGYLPPPPPEPDTAADTSATPTDTATNVNPDSITNKSDTTTDAITDSSLTDSINTDSLKPEPVEKLVEDTAFPIITVAEFTGHLYLDPRVKVVTEDARTYVKRYKNKFDVIYSLSSNTWSALASGSFALAENYLFTTEAFEDYWLSLSDSGFMMMEHQFYMPRIVSEVKNALTNLGVENPTSHFAVYNLPQMRRNIMFISKRPLTDSIRYHAFGELTQDKSDQIHLLYPPADSVKDSLIYNIVTEGWHNQSDSIAVDLSPSTDDRPFVAQMGLWKNFKFESPERLLPYEFFGYPLAKIIILIILLVVLFIIIPLNIIPFFTKSDHMRCAPWLYFFTIGLAFMAVEIILIQKYTLFIGTSIYSIVTVLLTLLLASGIGSRFSKKVSDKAAFLGIVIWLLLDVFVFKYLLTGFTGFTVFPRIIISIILIAPLGFFMGMPFPKGALKVGSLIDWGFAINGAASVMGATLIMLVAFNFGYSISLLCGALFYLIAYGLIIKKSAW